MDRMVARFFAMAQVSKEIGSSAVSYRSEDTLYRVNNLTINIPLTLFLGVTAIGH